MHHFTFLLSLILLFLSKNIAAVQDQKPDDEPGIIVRITVPIDPDLAGSCDELDLTKAKVSDHVQLQWDTVTKAAESSGFSIEQLRRAQEAVTKMIDTTPSQKKAKAWFLRRVEEPMLLLARDEIAGAYRQKAREAFVKISAELVDSLSSGEMPFTVDELLDVLARVDAKLNKVNALMEKDAPTAMGLLRSLGLAHYQKLLRNAVFLVKDTGEESKATRRAALSELQRALANSNDVIKTKCLVWQALR